MRPKALFAILLTLCVATTGLAAAADSGLPSIVIDGSPLSSDVPALVSGDHVLVPLRGVFEQFGAAVSFDESSGVATAMLGSTTVQITVGSRQARVNGRNETMDVAAREVAGRVMIPLRFVAQALGVSVDYDANSNTVVIVSGWKPGSFAAYAGGPVYTTVAHVPPTVENVRPASGTIVGSQYPSIYARFTGGTSAVDPSTVQIQLDGQDVSDQSTISSQYVSYTPMQALAAGEHNVEITGQSTDGTPFEEGWSFRVDAGAASDYTVGAYGGGAGFGYGFGSPALGFGWPWFHRFRFSPPGFSVFTPGPSYFVSGSIIEVVLISRFFPFGSGFFTVAGVPGQCALTPWLGHPGMFWGVMQVPDGVTAGNSVIEANFTLPDGRKVAVKSTAPIEIQGDRHSLPADLRYAVEPRLVNRPESLSQAVVFDRVEPRKDVGFGPLGSASSGASELQAGSRPSYRVVNGVREPVRYGEPVAAREPGARKPIISHETIEPARPIEPVFRPALPQWQSVGPSHPMTLGAGAKSIH